MFTEVKISYIFLWEIVYCEVIFNDLPFLLKEKKNDQIKIWQTKINEFAYIIKYFDIAVYCFILFILYTILM
jgi:hypothetical protein